MFSSEYLAGFFDGEGSVGIYRNGKGAWHLRTQVTQNITKWSKELFTDLVERHGGNLSAMRSPAYRRGAAYNWQTNGAVAVAFLHTILPSLRAKKEQVQLAIAWYDQRQRPQRDKLGRHILLDRDRPLDVNAAALLKELKRYDLDEVLESRPELMDVATQLKLL